MAGNNKYHIIEIERLAEEIVFNLGLIVIKNPKQEKVIKKCAKNIQRYRDSYIKALGDAFE